MRGERVQRYPFPRLAFGYTRRNDIGLREASALASLSDNTFPSGYASRKTRPIRTVCAVTG